MELNDDQAAADLSKNLKNSLWHIADQAKKDKEKQEDLLLMRETKQAHNESEIEKNRRINALKAEKEDFDYMPQENNKFSIGGIIGPLGRLKNAFKKKQISIKRRTDINYIDCIHVSPALNAIFLTGAFTDKYSQVYEADREYVKRYNKQKIINVFLPDGRRGKAVYNYDLLDENIEVKPITADEGIKKELRDIEESRDRLFIDDQTRTNIELDAGQLRVLLLAIFLSGALSFALASSIWIFLLFSGVI